LTELTKELKEGIASNPFREGEIYTRKIVYPICNPGKTWDAGGPWNTGYATSANKLIIFFNIKTTGVRGEDYDNFYDANKRDIKWCGKRGTHSNNPLMSNLIKGLTVPHFFARWDNTKPQFTYLGIGLIKDFEENFLSNAGKSIRFTVKCLERESEK